MTPEVKGTPTREANGSLFKCKRLAIVGLPFSAFLRCEDAPHYAAVAYGISSVWKGGTWQVYFAQQTSFAA